MPTCRNPVSIFLSYAREDEPLRKELEKHLSLLQRQGFLSTWHDRQIQPGANWAEMIDEQLEKASIILLLISADFLASDYCYGIEMQRALQRYEAGQAQVVPIFLRPVDWEMASFMYLQGLPHNGKAVTEWNNQDAAFADIAKGIRCVVEALTYVKVSQKPGPPLFVNTLTDNEKEKSCLNVEKHFKKRENRPSLWLLLRRKRSFRKKTLIQPLLVGILFLLVCSGGIGFVRGLLPLLPVEPITLEETLERYCSALSHQDFNQYNTLVPLQNRSAVPGPRGPYNTCIPLSDRPVVCSSINKIGFIEYDHTSDYKESLFLQSKNGRWSIIYRSDHYPSNISNCTDSGGW
jgi:TIR domain